MQGDLQENQFPDAGKEQPFEKSQYDPKAFFKVKAFQFPQTSLKIYKLPDKLFLSNP